MNKTVKGLIIAASVAAVVGIGAVSFAYWQGTAEPVIINGSTGVIRTIGNLTVTPSTASGTAEAMNALFPVDQNQKEGDSYLTYWEFTLSSDVTGDDPAVYKLAGVLDTKTSAALYWSASLPTKSTGAVEGNKLSATAVTLSGLTDDTVYVYMVATGTDAMKASITLTFSAE